MKVAGEASGIVIGGKLVFFAIEEKLTIGDPVAVAADGDTEVFRVVEPRGEAVLSEGDVRELAITVRRFDGGDEGSVFAELHLDPVGIPQGEESDRASVFAVTVGDCFQSRQGISRGFRQPRDDSDGGWLRWYLEPWARLGRRHGISSGLL